MDPVDIFIYTIASICVLMMLIDACRKGNTRTKENIWQKVKAIVIAIIVILVMSIMCL